MAPTLIIKKVPGNHPNQPNLIWGYMYDPAQRHLHHQKYNFFGLQNETTRIRCMECGKQVHGPNQLVNGRYCPACAEIVAARSPPAKLSHEAYLRHHRNLVSWRIAEV